MVNVAPGPRWAARLAAPAAFLLAATVAVLLVRAGLDQGDEPVTTPVPTTSAPSTVAQDEPSQGSQDGAGASEERRQFYVIRPGDTLEAVAARYGTTVEELRELNPEVDPVALSVGERIRVQ